MDPAALSVSWTFHCAALQAECSAQSENAQHHYSRYKNWVSQHQVCDNGEILCYFLADENKAEPRVSKSQRVLLEARS